MFAIVYMFSVVNVYHLKFCVVCINVCCSEGNVVSNECNEPTSCHVQPIGSVVKLCTLDVFALGVCLLSG